MSWENPRFVAAYFAFASLAIVFICVGGFGADAVRETFETVGLSAALSMLLAAAIMGSR